jgi:AbiJ N-terminal domain 3
VPGVPAATASTGGCRRLCVAQLLRLLAETIHPAVRTNADACNHLANEHNKLLRRDGVELHVDPHVSGLSVYACRPYVPSASEIRGSLASAIAARVKAYNVAAFYTKIGPGPISEDYGDPMGLQGHLRRTPRPARR